MKKRLLQILAVIFTVVILVTSFVVPAAAAEYVDYVEHYDGLVKDVIYFDDADAPEGYGIRSNLDQHYTVKTGETAIQFTNIITEDDNGLQGAWAYWETPYISDDCRLVFAQEYAVFDNKIPQITYQFIGESGSKMQVARFPTIGDYTGSMKLYYNSVWNDQDRDDTQAIRTVWTPGSDQICAFRDELYYDPYFASLTIRRLFWANGNYDTPAYTFEIVADTDLCFEQTDGTYAPEDFKIRGYIQHTNDYFYDNAVPIQMTRQIARTYKIALTHEEFLEHQQTIAQLEFNVALKDVTIEQLLEEKDQLALENLDLELDVWERDQIIAERDATIAEKDATIAAKDVTIAEKDATIAERDATIFSLREGLANTDAIGTFLDGMFSGVNGLITPWFDLGFGGITIGNALGVFGILAIIVIVVKLVRGGG